jgi:saccharopine dehydrogenase-like NADP-dependent oxidoreductase
MRIVELGCGVCGLVCAEHLARNPKVDELVLADARPNAAQALADRLDNDGITVQKVNGTDQKALRALLKGCDIVIATMPWRLNMIPLEVAAKVGANYLDFGMPMDSTGPEFDRCSKMCEDAGTTAMVGMGEEPGISDVFARYAVSKLDRADEANVYDGDTGAVEGLNFFSLWSPVDLLDETSVPAAIFKNGRIEFIPPMSSRQVYDFPAPLGRLPVYKTNHDETYFMPMAIKTLRNASFNIGIDDGFANAAITLRKMGMLSKELVNVKGVQVRPLDVVAALMPSPADFSDRVKGHTGFVVEVIGEKDGRRTKAKMWTTMSHEKAYELYNTNAGSYYVGTGGAIATEMFIDGEVKEKGFVIPEQLPTESFLERLRNKNVDFHIEVKPIRLSE